MTAPTPAPDSAARALRRAFAVAALGALAVTALTASVLTTATAAGAVTQTRGIDVSHYQGTINWAGVKASGAKFVYIKATEGTTYRDPNFSANYIGATNAGIIRGGYHFARPNSSSGATQAAYFLAHGGGWSPDGRTLPGALDLENTGGSAYCYGLSAAGMVSWIRSFSNYYHAQTGVYPVLYTRANWWNTCTGSNRTFAATNPLWLARYASTPGTLPAGWSYYTFWQYADQGSLPGDQDRFNGAYDRLVALCRG